MDFTITSITIDLSRRPSPTRVRAAAVYLSGLHASHHLRLHDPNEDTRVFHVEHALRPEATEAQHIEYVDTSSSSATTSTGATTPSGMRTPGADTDSASIASDASSASNASPTPSSPSSTAPNPPTSPRLPASFTIPPAKPPKGPHVTSAADTTPGGRAHTWLPMRERVKAERLAMAERVARRAAIEAQGGPARSTYRFDSLVKGPWQKQFVGPSVEEDYFSLEGVAGPSGTSVGPSGTTAADAQGEAAHGGDSDEESSEGPSDGSDYPSDLSSAVEAGPSRDGGRPGTPHPRVGRLERDKDSLSFRIEE
ncbi:hypothetical protein W97_06947 [Coniosporium apollinis CBS 100218]|uniref:Uncharacterized protein n=1 Tax=Coniosporium apollinis (strain CBS 100218) TaxID=1168221 RepID=R7Z0M6_CONA1|nr:uncharacterized protein W97_06947 [Coniosporium apollinis CBS 100218]EON67579.1 hypothetical protein W97_06947 [Coniosporium apollinis CBS 100218]